MASGNKAVQFGMLTVASVLIYSGIKGISVMDTLAGVGKDKPLDPAGAKPGAAGLQGTPALPVAGVSGSGPTGGKGKTIGYPCKGTHTIGGWQSDNAIDISVPIGTPIFAPEDGTVVKVKLKNDGCGGGGQFAGNQVTIQGRTTSFFLTHLCKVNVRTGQRVKAGTKIGESGEANGAPHLHFAVQTPANVCDYAGVAVDQAQCKVCRI
jgi:murein DD-endopeptidase MepM/ murein hydrolase activator NlpD